jgi:hypothetical protein
MDDVVTSINTIQIPASLRIGQTLHPAISPKQNKNRPLIIFGSGSLGIDTKPNVL